MEDEGEPATGSIGSLLGELTSGQRWTTGLAFGLALVLLLFGLPSPTRTILGASPSGATPAPTTTVASTPAPTTATPEAPSATPQPAAPPARIRPPTGGPLNAPQPTTGPPAPVGSTTTTPSTPSATNPAIVALVDTASSLDGRSDADMAQHFIDEAGLDATVEALDDVDRICALRSSVDLAVSSGPLPSAVDTCLRAAGVIVVSWTDAVPASDALSTRRGAARSLLDTASGLDLDGRAALVADARLRPTIEPVLGQAARAGLAFEETVWLDGAAGPDVAVGLASLDLDHVVFATSSDNQSTVVTQLRVFTPGVATVVLDAADSVVNGDLSPALDGARAVTAVQFPWDPGDDDLRTTCRSSWEQTRTPPTTFGDDELLRVLQWCQHVRLAATIAADLASGDEPLSAPHPSPLTSALGPLPSGGFGPARLTTATWSASCGCWSSDKAFEAAR